MTCSDLVEKTLLSFRTPKSDGLYGGHDEALFVGYLFDTIAGLTKFRAKTELCHHEIQIKDASWCLAFEAFGGLSSAPALCEPTACQGWIPEDQFSTKFKRKAHSIALLKIVSSSNTRKTKQKQDKKHTATR